MKAEKILSLLMAWAIPFPLLIAGTASAFERIPLWAVLGGISGAVISWILGQLLGTLLKSAVKKALYIVRVFSVITGLAVAVLCEAAIFAFKMGSLAPMFIPLAYLFWYWFGFRTGSKQKAVTPIVMGAYGVEAVFMYPICASFNRDAAFYIILITAFLTVLGALLINFRQVSGLSLRGKSEKRLLTKSCVRFNVKATLVFCGILLFAFFFAETGAKWLWEGVKAVIRFIIFLMGLLGAMMSKKDYDSEQPDSLLAMIGANDNTVGWILTYIIAIALAVLFFKPFVKLMKSLYRAIMNKLGREPLKAEETEYTDVYQNSDRQKSDKSTFKKAFKAFSRERDLQKKFRLGYKAFMVGLSEKNTELAPCDTPKNHLEKGKALTETDNLNKTVEAYIAVRYDDRLASNEDCEVVRELLKEIK